MKAQKNKEKTMTNKIKIHPLYEKNLTYLFTRTATLLKEEFVELLAKDNIVGPQKSILTLLKNSNNYNQYKLCEELEINKTSMVRFLDGLELKGFVERECSELDRRENFIRLTTVGQKALTRIEKECQTIEDRFFANLTKKDADFLRQLLLKINNHNPANKAQ